MVDTIESDFNNDKKSECGDTMTMKADKKKERKSLSLVDYILLICLNVLITCIILVVYTKLFVPSLAVVDFDSYLLGVRNLYLSGRISDDDVKKYIDQAVEIIKNEGKGYTVILGGSVILRDKNIKQISLPQLPKEAYDINMTSLFVNPPSGQNSPFPFAR